MDFLPQERERGITISSAAIAVSWKNHSINIIDTPGHVDFTVEVERSVRVLDSAVVIVDAVAGVQAQTRTVWKLAQKNSLPAVVFANKMDRDGASFEKTIKSLKDKLSINGIPIQYPIIKNDEFVGLVDLTTMNSISWPVQNTKTPLPPIIQQITNDHPNYSEIQEARNNMFESIADVDEDFMLMYLNDSNEITIPIIRSTLRKVCLNRKLVPVLCGASLKGKGIEPLLDAVIEYLPSPIDRIPDIARNTETGEEIQILPNNQDLYALAFKVIFDRARGPLVFVRVYSGSLASRKQLFNTTKQKKDIPNQVLHINAGDLIQSQAIEAGNIGCIVGFKSTSTGDTIIESTNSNHKHFIMKGMTIPPNVFSVSIEPEKSSQQQELTKALDILTLEDPSLQYEISEESGQVIIRGLGELHLDIVCDKLKRQFNIEVHISKTYIAYRESVSLSQEPVTTEHILDRVIGNNRLFCGFNVVLSRSDYSLPPTITLHNDLKKKLTPLEKDTIFDAFESCFSSGVKGFPLVGLSFEITSFLKDQDTTEGAIRAGIVTYIHSVMKNIDMVVLEPIMTLEVECSQDSVGDILSDLSVKRRADIKEVIPLPGSNSIIHATVPFATMLGYATDLRSMTHGQGTFSIEYSSHQIVEQF